jgi:hypothetical protein
MTRAEGAAIARAKRAEKLPPLPERFWSKVDIKSDDECWPWKAAVRKESEGYGAFWMHGRHHPANRVALQLSGVDVPDGMVACHKCDNPRCCNPKHLFVGTPRANNDDKVSKGRNPRGQFHGMARLTDAQTSEILALKPANGKRLAAGVPQKIADKYGITKQYVSELMGKKQPNSQGAAS